MITERQQIILKAIVEEFVDKAEPVGSKTLQTRYQLDYSTATIRNEMMALEENGLLEKTHTSSGRVPSSYGYKFYVENLMDNQLDDDTKYELQKALKVSSQGSSKEVIESCCDVLSHMSNLTSIVLGPDARSQTLAHIRLFPLDNHSAVAIIITDKGHTENKTFHFEDDISMEDLQNCCNILNDRLTGTPLNELVEKMQNIKPILADQVKKHEMLFNAFVEAFVKFASENMYFSGTSNMLYQPEFEDIEKIRHLMNMLENRELWRNIGDETNSLMLKSGNGGELVWLDDMAVISTKLNFNETDEGQLMIVGPSRMDYDKVVSMLNYVRQLIESRYKK